ncbi:hypothetical protein F2Q69_00015291 [Brassica cretica]|uniref:Uncharacterized protein n=1 Tax=Brassica cretica TaxID=69181 RepID=A0A8S9QW50_BRACR|nr:hypothetical protein F2Q69_00015291 [Brassica cretica]
MVATKISGAVRVEELFELKEEVSEIAVGGVKVEEDVSFKFQVFEEFMKNFMEVFLEIFHENFMLVKSSEVFYEVFPSLPNSRKS